MAIAGSEKSRRTLVSTRNTDDIGGWLELLSSLSDDELSRYGEIAQDQRNLEYDRWWAQVLCMLAAGSGFGLAVREFWSGGNSRTAVALLIAAIAASIWPYRKAKMRRLWGRHCRAVAQEQGRRGKQTE